MRASDDLDQIFAALADPTRRAIVARLAAGSRLPVTDLAAVFPMSLNAVSKHVKVLERSGLIRREVSGRVHYCSLNPAPLRTSEAWIEETRRFWEGRLSALAVFMRDRLATAGAPRPIK